MSGAMHDVEVHFVVVAMEVKGWRLQELVILVQVLPLMHK
jgi:hypothetical protein